MKKLLCFILGLLILCANSLAFAETANSYIIKEANPLGYPQSTWENNAIIELNDQTRILQLESILNNAALLNDTPNVGNFGIIDSYHIQGKDRNGTLYYDTLYYRTSWEENGQFYDLGEAAGRFIKNLFQIGTKRYDPIPEDHAALFKEYGWTLDFALGTKNITLPDKLLFSASSENQTYFAYRNLFLRDSGYNIEPFLGQKVDVSLYWIHEGVNRLLWCPEDVYFINDKDLGVIIQMRGIVLSSQGQVIGAFLDAGRHNATFACSMSGKSDSQILGQETLLDYIHTHSEEPSLNIKLAELTPEELIRMYAETSNNALAYACYGSEKRLELLTTNMNDNGLFVPWATTIEPPRLIVGSVEDHESYYTINLEDGRQFYPELVYEGEGYGWRIESFFNTGY